MPEYNWTGGGANWEARIQPAAGPPRLLGWNVPADELQYVPEHWLSFPEPNPAMHYLLGLLYILFTFIALLGNGLVIWIFCSAKSLRTPSNIFVVNLAILDFMMMMKTPIFIYNSFNTGFALGHLGCEIFGVMGTISGMGAGMTNAAIAYDRYSTIARPLDGKLSRGQVIMLVTLIWTYVLPWALMPLLGVWGRFAPEGYLTSCTFDYLTDTDETRYFVATIFTFSYIFPMSMIIYFYSQIVGFVVNHEKALRAQAKKMNVESLRSGQKQQEQSAEVRIAKAAITVCFLFVAAWTPYGVMAMIGAFGNKALLSPSVTMIPACCCKAVACLDPYVYAISHPRYRLELQKRLPWLELQEKAPAPADAQSTTTEAVNANASG
ncbi:opsin, ultraviolet-sensitive isoform X2 [Phymastichus coffea]|uniref:opsin, ultraviolet-sensitive isoform X2 n=1 Tax=Phymastichus coffea TaxID=108790 RepID=UPI00273C9728|nr:opsin, ultraviolet-sensitive isoform X2 [Phymastichus coffea]